MQLICGGLQHFLQHQGEAHGLDDAVDDRFTSRLALNLGDRFSLLATHFVFLERSF